MSINEKIDIFVQSLGVPMRTVAHWLDVDEEDLQGWIDGEPLTAEERNMMERVMKKTTDYFLE